MPTLYVLDLNNFFTTFTNSASGWIFILLFITSFTSRKLHRCSLRFLDVRVNKVTLSLPSGVFYRRRCPGRFRWNFGDPIDEISRARKKIESPCEWFTWNFRDRKKFRVFMSFIFLVLLCRCEVFHFSCYFAQNWKPTVMLLCKVMLCPYNDDGKKLYLYCILLPFLLSNSNQY